MNNLLQDLQTQAKERFDENAKSWFFGGDCCCSEVRDFLDSEIRTAVEAGIKAVNLPTYDHSKCPIKATCIGYMNAESDLDNIKKELLSTLTLPKEEHE
jgi:hypothetical protein